MLFPGSYYVRLRPRLDQLTITYRGPGGSLTLIVVDMKTHRLWSYELIQPCTLHRGFDLHTLSPPHTFSSSTPVLLTSSSQRPFVPPLPRLPSSPPAPFHPLIAFKCQPWPLSLTPERPPNHGLIWDICSYILTRRWQTHIYTKFWFTRSILHIQTHTHTHAEDKWKN